MGTSSLRGLALGITGGIACGKSEVGRILEGFGWAVLDADDVARDLLSRGTEEYGRVTDIFGKAIIGFDGAIDRVRLGRMVFGNPEKLEMLNAIVHPRTLEICRRWVRDNRPERSVAVIIALLFEVGATELWDAVVCVESPSRKVLERLSKRGLSRQEAQRRIDSQMDIKEKMARSDYVISNNGDLSDLYEATQRMIECMESKERK